MRCCSKAPAFKSRRGGAIVLCANTAHVVAERLEAAVGLHHPHRHGDGAEITAAAADRGAARHPIHHGAAVFRDKMRQHGIETLIPERSTPAISFSARCATNWAAAWRRRPPRALIWR